MLCRFVLPYSNWQWATICHSESMSSLKRGIQEAVFRLGGVPLYHQTDHSTAATHRLSKKDAENPREEDKEARQGRGFNDDYLALMRHLGMGAKEQKWRCGGTERCTQTPTEATLADGQ
ncbi:MAG: transposase family protein [bacterium]|nr:transposase family protein [bacterium]